MYQINEKLVRNLSKMLGMSQRRFSEQTFKHNQVWPQRMTFFDRMLLSDLVMVSNRWHIPMRYLICEESDAVIPESIAAIQQQGAWKEVKIDVEAFRRAYQRACSAKGRNAVSQALGVTNSCVWRWVTVRFTVRAQTICDFCNFAGVDYHDFVRDANSGQSVPCGKDQASAAQVAGAGGNCLSGSGEFAAVQGALARLQGESSVFAAGLRSLRLQMDQVRGILLGRGGKDGEAHAQMMGVLRGTGFAGAEGLLSPYGWQAGNWGDGVPTLREVVERCNAEQQPTSHFLVHPAVVAEFGSGNVQEDGGGFCPVVLNFSALRVVMQSYGMADAVPEDVSVLDFCGALDALHLTPACCIDDANANYPRLFADGMVRTLAEKA